jgi:hypothetical protein
MEDMPTSFGFIWEKQIQYLDNLPDQENMKVLSSESSGMYCRVLKSMSTDVSEVCATSIIRVIRQHTPLKRWSTSI